MIRTNWTLELLRLSASKYPTRSKWKSSEPNAYKAALNKGLLDVVCAHMKHSYKPNGYWTKENIILSASKFLSVAEWNEAETTAVQRARKHGWLDEATAHMRPTSVPIGPMLIHQYLLINNIDYVSEKRFLKHTVVAKKPFDFYIPKLKLIIEYHGKQHQLGWKGSEDSKETIQLNDAIKKDWAIAQGYNFLEITSWSEKDKDSIISKLETSIHEIAKQLKLSIVTSQRELTNFELDKLQTGSAFT